MRHLLIVDGRFELAGGFFEMCSDFSTVPNSLGGFSPVLYCQGDCSLLGKASVAIIGTRTPTDEGIRAAVDAAQKACREGLVVVSGLAAGIDTAAHMTALECGKTIAFLPFPLDGPVYPRTNAVLLEDIKRRGLAVSQFCSGTSAQKWCFAERSRRIASYADFVILIEDQEEGGGRKACDFALKSGKLVLIPERFYYRTAIRWKRPLDGHLVQGPAEFAGLAALKKDIIVQGELF
jgi:predicted Rossmann fold nucleotide-binding protein DprA/Smf involved in DNA uptake